MSHDNEAARRVVGMNKRDKSWEWWSSNESWKWISATSHENGEARTSHVNGETRRVMRMEMQNSTSWLHKLQSYGARKMNAENTTRTSITSLNKIKIKSATTVAPVTPLTRFSSLPSKSRCSLRSSVQNEPAIMQSVRSILADISFPWAVCLYKRVIKRKHSTQEESCCPEVMPTRR